MSYEHADDAILTVNDVALQTGIPKRTLLNHIREGRLVARKLGCATTPWIIHQAHLDRYLAERTANQSDLVGPPN